MGVPPISGAVMARLVPGFVAGRGYHVVYREHEVNHCPGCGRSHWLIGRVSAECAFCSTALPLEATLHVQDAALERPRLVRCKPEPRVAEIRLDAVSNRRRVPLAA